MLDFKSKVPVLTNDKNPYTYTDLMQQIKEGKTYTYYPFYSNKESKAGSIINRGCLSQWYMHKFVVDEIEYNCMEQYMMAAKARLMGDEKVLDRIMQEKSQREIKQLGREVKNFNQKIWNEQKFWIVVYGNYYKFTSDSRLTDFIKGTGDCILVEASPRDRIWGIGLGIQNPDVQRPALWKGENLLGFALTRVRSIIRESEV